MGTTHARLFHRLVEGPLRERAKDEVLPWAYIDNGMKPELLERQYQKALSSIAPALSPA